MNWKRARTTDKKNERIDAILIAAFALFKEHGYEKVSFNAIAAEAGFTKSNLYRYFSSKEEVFLNIFSDLFGAWIEDCHKELETLSENASTEQFANAWLKSMSPHSRYLDLAPLMLTSLERNSSFEQLVEFKRQSMERLYGIAVAICRIYPALTIDDGFRYLTLSFAATTNYWAGATTNDALNKVYQMEEFSMLKPNFEYNLICSIEIILHGLGIPQSKDKQALINEER